LTDGLTAKEEAFCTEYVLTSNASEAYRNACDVSEGTKPESIWQSASRMMAKVKVSSRIMELQAEARERSLVTVESITKELDENRKKADDLDQPAAMNTATATKAKLHGLMVDKAEQTITVNAVNLSKDVADI